ncbi:MAG: ABC transporter permease [Lachnospiraceae bacterium]|nr:ABC transporter permease [Lachnospiraceae bacterium]
MSARLLLQTADQKNRFSEIYEENQFYTIMDNLVGDKEYMHTDPEMIPVFKRFYNLLLNSESFEYVELYDNPVYLDDYNGPENNVSGYEHGNTIESQTYEFVDDKGIVTKSTCVKAVWFGLNTIPFFDLKISEGRGFTEEDLILDPGKPISVILGYSYKDLYDVGDVLSIKYVFNESKAEIIGFLDEGSNVFRGTSFMKIDNYVVMPIFTNDDYYGAPIYNIPVNFMYSFRTQGTVASKLSANDVEKIITEYCAEAGFGDRYDSVYYVVEDASSERYGFGEGINTLVFLIGIIAVSVVVVIFVIEILINIKRTNNGKRYYAILFLNGCNYSSMLCLVAAESFLSALLASLTGAALYNLIFAPGREEALAILAGGTVYFLLPFLVFVSMISEKRTMDYIRKTND